MVDNYLISDVCSKILLKLYFKNDNYVCLASILIYKATVKTNNTTKIYIGIWNILVQLLKINTGIVKQPSTINKKDTVQNYRTIYGN